MCPLQRLLCFFTHYVLKSLILLQILPLWPSMFSPSWSYPRSFLLSPHSDIQSERPCWLRVLNLSALVIITTVAFTAVGPGAVFPRQTAWYRNECTDDLVSEGPVHVYHIYCLPVWLWETIRWHFWGPFNLELPLFQRPAVRSSESTEKSAPHTASIMGSSTNCCYWPMFCSPVLISIS